MSDRMLVAATALGVLLGGGWAQAAKVGDVLKDVTLKDANGEPIRIPDFGKKILTIIYGDMQAADANDPLADALKAKEFDKSVVRGLGVANMADSWAPDFAIRMIVRRKIEKYKSTVLTDDDKLLAKAWELGDCDDTSVVLVIGADGKVLYAKKGVVEAAEIPAVVGLMDTEANKALAAAKPAALEQTEATPTY